MDLSLDGREMSDWGGPSSVLELSNGAAPARDKGSGLQEFIFPTSPEGLDLYLRPLSGELAYGQGMRTYGPARISFNTYFNSFYEDYWVTYTSVSEIELVISGEGRFWCSIFREHTTSGCALIGRHFVELGSAETKEVRLPVSLVPEGHGHGGRLFVDLELSRPAAISAMSWVTRQKPMRNVQLGVGICTFNREAFVTRTVRRLLEAPEEAAIAKVVVINQGGPLASDAFVVLSKQAGPRLSVHAQANFGGAGGFTRSAIELLKERSVTHVLFMDDDIELDPRHLVTTTAFLRYARKPVVVGGHMLDLFRRNILYEAGNSISPDNQLRPNHHNRDLNQLSTLSALSRVAKSHFNGWWYAAIPASCFRDFGLPAPVFIRGDDLEFGMRLHRAGIETAALPPVSVWHEPFYAKAPGWQLYYDLRNRLIFASVHEGFALDSPERLMKLLMVHLIKYDYQHAWFMMAAITDFLKGPSLLEEGLPEIHARVTGESAALAPRRSGAALGIGEAAADHPSKPWAIRRRMLVSLARALAGRPRRGAYGVQYTDKPLQWIKLGPAYLLSDREGHFFLQFAYSRALTWKIGGKTTKTILNYRRRRQEAARAWREAFPHLVSDEHWHHLLGLREEDAEPDAKAA